MSAVLSTGLWRALGQVERGDSITLRFSGAGRGLRRQRESSALPRKLLALGIVVTAIALIAAPQLLTLVVALPLMALSLVVLTPVLLPFFAPLLGALLTSEIVAGIARERSQHTWQLLCACPGGALQASLSCAIGIAQRTSWLLPLRFLARMTLRAAAALWIALAALGLWLALSGQQPLGAEQARLLLLLLLGMGLYHAQLAQTLWLAALCGLWASAFAWRHADAALAGLCLYLGLAVLPLLAAGWLAGRGGALAGIALALAFREAAAWIMWRGLRWRL